MKIKTFVINLPQRRDRKEHTLEQFFEKNEFEVVIVEAQVHKIGAVGLWTTIVDIIKTAIAGDDELIIICEDDHQFTNQYSKEFFFDAIENAKNFGADILSGGISSCSNCIKVSDFLFWNESFTGFQFTIIFRKFFLQMLSVSFEMDDATDYKVSSMTVNTFFIFPFISIQKDFGYSDATSANNTRNVEDLFKHCSDKISYLDQIYTVVKKTKKEIPLEILDKRYLDYSIPTFIISENYCLTKIVRVAGELQPRSEFLLHEDSRGWSSPPLKLNLFSQIKKAVQIAIENNDDVIIFCTDDHSFSEHYSKRFLIRNILESYLQGAEVISGSAEKIDMAIPVTGYRYWTNTYFSGTFFIVFKQLFNKLLDFISSDKLTLFEVLSKVSNKKNLLLPFIADVDLEKATTETSKKMRITANRLGTIGYISKTIGSLN